MKYWNEREREKKKIIELHFLPVLVDNVLIAMSGSGNIFHTAIGKQHCWLDGRGENGQYFELCKYLNITILFSSDLA